MLVIPVVIGIDCRRPRGQSNTHRSVVSEVMGAPMGCANTFVPTVLREPGRSLGVLRSRWLHCMGLPVCHGRVTLRWRGAFVMVVRYGATNLP